jgi:uncharacterized membrane protein YgdD (TMEM256/DUF423 family)
MNGSPTRVRSFFTLGSIFGGIGVIAGAFGSHGLRSSIPPEMLTIFETAVRYQMYHSFGLMATAWAIGRWSGEKPVGLETAGWCFVTGILLFCGSLYALALTGKLWLGAITPFGGVAFAIGWIVLAWSAWKTN